MVDYPHPLLPGTLLARYKRFFADVKLEDGSHIVAHCPNTGRMTGHNRPGLPVRVSRADNPRRKLKWTLEQVHDGRSWVGVNTVLANRVVREAIEAGLVEALAGYERIETERPYGQSSRIDLLLSGHAERPDQRCYVEVKNTTLGRGDWGLFPDAVTARGTRHLNELVDQVRAGQRGVVLFSVQREDSRRFRPADDVDPVYGETLRRVVRAGVEAYAYGGQLSDRAVRLVRSLPVVL